MSAAMPGGCLCGAVRFTATPEMDAMHACHCSSCRRWSAGPFMGVPCGDAVTIEDESNLGVYVSSDWAERCFCKVCGTTLIWRLREGGGHIVISAQAFDDPSVFKLEEEIFVDQQPKNYSLTGKQPRLTGEQVFARFNAGAEGA